MNKKLPLSFFQRDTALVAQELLGKRLVRVFRGQRRSGIIVETEAYLGADDPACHSWKNRSSVRTNPMYLAGGYIYVYLVYGMHHCFNIVSKGVGEPEAVLIRALEPEEGVSARADGPGRLCKALAITRAQSGEKLGQTIFVEEAEVPSKSEIGVSGRIGVEYAGEAARWPLRFYWKGNPHLSRKEKK